MCHRESFSGLCFAVALTPIGDEGAAVLATALSTGTPSHGLAPGGCDVGDKGALALAAALPAAGQGCKSTHRASFEGRPRGGRGEVEGS